MAGTILCFGDSNTFGLKPSPAPWTRERWAKDQRWPSVLGSLTGHEIISEGLPGRTATTVNAASPHLDAIPFIPVMMESHTPIDVVVTMLGTNDLQATLNLTPEAISLSVFRIVKSLMHSDRVLGSKPPAVLVVAPPPVEEIGFRSVTFAGASAKSRALAPLYRDLAQSLGVGFLDAAHETAVSAADGIHLEPADHRALARAVALQLDDLLDKR